MFFQTCVSPLNALEEKLKLLQRKDEMAAAAQMRAQLKEREELQEARRREREDRDKLREEQRQRFEEEKHRKKEEKEQRRLEKERVRNRRSSQRFLYGEVRRGVMNLIDRNERS